MANREIAALKAFRAAHPNPPDAAIADIRAANERQRAAAPRADLQAERIALNGVASDRLAMPGSAADRAVLHFHGGGYVFGSAATHRAFGADLAFATRSTVYMADYRLAPEHPFPAAFDDAVASYRGLLDTGLAPDRIALGGDSAGAGLALAVAIEARRRGWPLPGALALLSPWIDLACDGETWRSLQSADPGTARAYLLQLAGYYAGAVPLGDWRLSPLYGDLAGLPPMLILAGTDEVFLSDAIALYGRTKAAGIEASLEIWPDMIHVWPTWPDHLGAAKQAIGRIADFIRDHSAAR